MCDCELKNTLYTVYVLYEHTSIVIIIELQNEIGGENVICTSIESLFYCCIFNIVN